MYVEGAVRGLVCGVGEDGWRGMGVLLREGVDGGLRVF